MANNYGGNFPSFDEYLNQHKIRQDRERYPFYSDNADYNTNSKSYYDDLARKNKLIEILAKRIWEYDEELAKRFEEWDKNLEELPEDLKKLLEKWMEDGTLDKIINENIFNDLNDKIDNKMGLEGYYNEHQTFYYRDDESETSYEIMKIPKYDDNGEIIEIKVTDDRDMNGNLSYKTTEFSKMKQATAMINASPNSATNNINDRLTIMNNGDVRREDNNFREYNYLIGWDKENNFKSFPPDTSVYDLKSNGYVTVIPAFLPLIDNGKDITNSTPMESLGNTTDPNPRTVIAQDYDNNTLFFTSTGRLIGEYGMKTKDVVRVLKKHNVKWAHMLDGGGSSTLVNYHQIINRLSGASSGDRGTTERRVRNAIYIGKNNVNKTATNVLSLIGENFKASYKQNKYLEALRYQKNNYIALEDYFINGWKPFTTSGDNTPRAWVLPNNTVYFRGVVTEGSFSDEENTTFIKLPFSVPPMFTTHHLVAGNNKGDIYKVIIDTDGYMTWYFWDDRTSVTEKDRERPYYIRLDGIFIQLNYTSAVGGNRTQGIQSGWTPNL